MLFKKAAPPASQVVPTGTLKRLQPSEIIPSRNNPRLLFYPEPLRELKESIRQHGVLVPITVFQPKGQQKYSILDGERRYRCCVELASEGLDITIPANVVDPPDKTAGLLYMFSIHNFREPWELMPTALSLQTVMRELGEDDTKALSRLAGLSEPQIERCKKLLAMPERFQRMSLDTDPKTRIPSNFWIEAFPVIDLYEKVLPDVAATLGKEGIIEQLVEKYRAGGITSVIHFRRIMEAYEVGQAESTEFEYEEAGPSGFDDERRGAVVERMREYIQDIHLETRAAFDEFVREGRQVQGALEACDTFIRKLERLKLDYIVDRDNVMKALEQVRDLVDQLLHKLEGSDAPPEETDESEED